VGFVLVPVPAEHVLDVMRWVLFRSEAESGDERQRDAARVLGLLREADPDLRALLELVAAATIRGELLRLRDLADELGREVPDVTDTIEGLNSSVLDDGRPLIEVRAEQAVGVFGQKGAITYVAMHPHVARVVRLAMREVAPG
jgi:hypothetical protein